MMLLIPHFTLIGIILAAHPSQPSDSPVGEKNASSVPHANPTEGSVAWQTNLRAIQNLMGAVYVHPSPTLFRSLIVLQL
jgi:hypothetical protein